MSDQKPSFVFNNYLLLHFFKLTATSLVNSCPMQNQKTLSDDVHYFYVLFGLPSFACASLLSMVLRDCWCEHVTICNISSLRAPIFFQSTKKKKKSCTRSICTEVGGDFCLYFHYTPPNLMITNMAWGRCLFLPGASSQKCRVLFHQVSWHSLHFH